MRAVCVVDDIIWNMKWGTFRDVSGVVVVRC